MSFNDNSFSFVVVVVFAMFEKGGTRKERKRLHNFVSASKGDG